VMIVDRLNQLDEASLVAALAQCCAAPRWVEAMAAGRPFASDENLLTQASEIWHWLGHDDFLAAFAAHPKIGDVESLRAKYAATRAWASGEQAGVVAASQEVLERLAKLNHEYERKFGYIFIVCATGKTAAEMLAILESRLPNDPDAELQIASAEQLKITLLRLQKLAP